jgi:hypothetical protein
VSIDNSLNWVKITAASTNLDAKREIAANINYYYIKKRGYVDVSVPWPFHEMKDPGRVASTL